MDEKNNNSLIFILLALAVIQLALVYIDDSKKTHRIFQKNDKILVTKLTSIPIIVDETNAGPMDYYSAVSYCKSKGMYLPTREQAWELWRASAACKVAKVANKPMIKNKTIFLKSCHNSNLPCTVPANKINYTCNPNDDLLFLDEKSYRYGNYWLQDKYDRNGHYTANFITGATNAYADKIDLLGVRCVSEASHLQD